MKEWLVDSGATVNGTQSDKYLQNVMQCDTTITVGNDKGVNVVKQGGVVLMEKNLGQRLSIHAMVCKQVPKHILSTK